MDDQLTSVGPISKRSRLVQAAALYEAQLSIFGDRLWKPLPVGLRSVCVKPKSTPWSGRFFARVEESQCPACQFENNEKYETMPNGALYPRPS